MPLTDDQYRQMADALFGTGLSPCIYSRHEFDHEWTGEDVEAIAEKECVFRCDSCDEWMETASRSPSDPSICQACRLDLGD